jgi:catechol 2,3-dioxygenase-like lactoylglutathione lyase family enzyme
MLEDGGVAARLPAQDLQRARVFYAEKLGLEPSEERPGGLLYQCARGEFALFESDGAPQGRIPRWPGRSTISRRPSRNSRPARAVRAVRLAGLTTQNDIAQVDGNYPSKGGVASEPRGSKTARAICSRSASRGVSAVRGLRRLLICRYGRLAPCFQWRPKRVPNDRSGGRVGCATWPCAGPTAIVGRT